MFATGFCRVKGVFGYLDKALDTILAYPCNYPTLKLKFLYIMFFNFFSSTYILGILFFIVWGTMGCREEVNPSFDFERYARNLPVNNPEACAARIKTDIMPRYRTWACKVLFHTLPESTPLKTIFAHLDAFERNNFMDPPGHFTNMVRGELYNKIGKPDSARYFLEIALNTARCEKMPPEDYIDPMRHIGRSYLLEGNYPEAIRILIQAIDMVPQPKDFTDRYFNLYWDIADAYLRSGDYRNAQKWNLRTWTSAMKDPDHSKGFQITAAARLSDNYRQIGLIDSALLMATKALQLQEQAGLTTNQDFLYFTMAKALQANNQCLQALRYYHKATCCISPEKQRAKLLMYHQSEADCYLCLNQLDSAEYLYKLSLQSLDTSALADAYKNLSVLEQRKGNFEAALNYAITSRRFNDIAFNAERLRIVGELNMRHLTAKQERKFAEQEKSEKIARLQMLVAFLALAVTLGLGIFFFTRQNHKHRIMEKEKQILIQEKQLLEIREALQSQQLEHSHSVLKSKNKELEESSQILMLKNRLIADLKLQLSQKSDYQESVPGDASMKAESLRRIKILNDSDWMDFRAQYEQIFPGFTSRLQDEFPALTAAEVRLFLLMKLGFDNKEIAAALGISVESVWKNRHRLRKKLALSESDNFDLFIQKFG